MEGQEPGSVTIQRRHADTHWLRLREERRTGETGGALFSGPRQFEPPKCDSDDDEPGVWSLGAHLVKSEEDFGGSVPI